jgi:NADPH:quinone reductase-like Zn-dependent oxidoreductase
VTPPPPADTPVERYRRGVIAATGGVGVTIADILLALAARHAGTSVAALDTRDACAALGAGLTTEPFPSAADLRAHFGMDAALRGTL